MRMKIKADVKDLKSMFEKIYPFESGGWNNEIPVILSNGYFTIKYVDPAHVAMCISHLKIKGYRKSEPIIFSVDAEDVYDVLKHIPYPKKKGISDSHPERVVNISINVNESITFSHPALEYTTAIKSEKEMEVGIPKVPTLPRPEAVATINTKQLMLFLKIANKFTDHMVFVADKRRNKLYAEFMGDTNWAKTDLTYSLGGIEGISLKFNKVEGKYTSKVRALFPLDYMIDIVKHIKAPIIEIELKTDYPLKVNWEESPRLSGYYLLAPRIECEW